MLKLEPIDFGRRVAVEKELASDPEAPPPNAIFDESGNFVLYPTLLGIKVGFVACSVVCVRACVRARAGLHGSMCCVRVRLWVSFTPCALATQLTLPRCMHACVQVVNLVTNRLVKVVGKVESGERFLRIALYQVCARACVHVRGHEHVRPQTPPPAHPPAHLTHPPTHPPTTSPTHPPTRPPTRAPRACRARAARCPAGPTRA